MIPSHEHPTMICSDPDGDGGSTNQGGKTGLGDKRPSRQRSAEDPSGTPEPDAGTSGKKTRTIRALGDS